MPSKTLQDLITLAREPSSARRRELLREITDLFFKSDGERAPTEMGLFDDVLTHLTGEMEAAVRAELAEQIADAANPPPALTRKLAGDVIGVAGPVLRRSLALSDADLLRVAKAFGQDHLRAISQRPTVSVVVSDAIVERADDVTLNVLLRNERAELSRASHETAVDRATNNPDLHEAVVRRRALPVDLLNEMYFVVENRLRNEILERNAELDPAALEVALAAGRKRLASRDGALPPDYAEAETYIRNLASREAITSAMLTGFLRNGEKTKFLVALCELGDIDFHTAQRILEHRQLDALAVVCKAADFDRQLFLTFAVLILDREVNAMGRAREYGQIYADLPRDTAQRTLRFWRMRRQTGDVAAA